MPHSFFTLTIFELVVSIIKPACYILFRKKDALTEINISICIEISTPMFVKAW